MTGIYSSPSPSLYPIEKIEDFPYPYQSIPVKTDSDNTHKNGFFCHLYF